MRDPSRPLARLALSRSALDRAAHRRAEPGLLPGLLADPATRIASIRIDRMPKTETDGRLALAYRSPEPADADRLAFFLGVLPSLPTTAYVGVVEQEEPPERGWATLRGVGAILGDLDAGVFTATQALANWHRTHTHCPRCGAPTRPISGGWVRLCPADGSEHFPRTDPAVIMAVLDADDRLLVGRGLGWPEGQFSVLAGFVEPGESFEAAVVREVEEESGVRVTTVRYRGSQPWPFPSSIMVGCTARAVTTTLNVDHQELAEARWVSREEYAAGLRAGRLRTPGGSSIARRLIEEWLDASIEEAAGGAALQPWRPS